MGEFDFTLMKDAFTGDIDECGDEGVVIEKEEKIFVSLIDALGHGKEAFDTAQRAKTYIMDHHREELPRIIDGLDRHMKGSRGLVGAFCHIDGEKGELRYAGIGNISARIHGRNGCMLMPRDGIVGYLIPTPREQRVPFGHKDTLVLNSDGIREHFPLIEYPDLLTGASEEIAVRLFSLLRNRDDASCLVVRYRK